MKKASAYSISLLLALTLAACSKEPPPPAPIKQVTAAGVTVTAVEVGKAIGPDKKITQPAETFARNDTVYVSVETQGSGTAGLRAKWTFHKGEKSVMVNETTQTIMATGPATSEFHVANPDGWPAGIYQVEIVLNDQTAGSKRFVVK